MLATDYVECNRALWEQRSDDYQAHHGCRLSSDSPGWGAWQIPEDELGVLGEVKGLDVLELGCGAAQWSIALARRGARPVGLDLSPRQLAHARRLMRTAGIDFPLIVGNAEAVPLADASFDIVLSDYGATTYTDPYRTVPEAARLLRPGGLLASSGGTPWLEVCWPHGARHPSGHLHRDYYAMHRLDLPDSVDFQLPYGAWIRLFRSCGLVIEDLVELRPAADAVSTFRDAEALAWARRWPAEHIWKVRKP
jgi:SAM-dependent methyltransferase